MKNLNFQKLEQKPASTHIRQLGYVRALGVTLVLLYHFYPKLLPGGFIGVDVFFVFSGYLITALALEEYRKSHSFDIKKFAERRFFRIFPTVAFSMLIILPLTLFGTADLRYNLASQVFAGLGFFTNFYEMSTGISYATSFAPHIFVHLWSLALEVQFYIFWGLLIWLLARRFKRGIKGQVFILSALIFIGSSLIMTLSALTSTNLSELYYSPLSHIFPFFLGGILATIAGIHTSPLIRNLSRQWTQQRVMIGSALSAVVLLLLSLFLQFDSKLTFAIGFLLAALAAVSLILHLRLLHEKTESQEPLVIRWLADISYGVYIFHWPFLIVFENFRLSHGLSVLLSVILSLGLASLMLYLIDPWLRGRKSYSLSIKRAIWAVAGLLLIASGVAVSQTSNETTLAQTLWTGSNQQTVQQLTESEKMLQTGTFGAKNLVIGDSVALGTTTNFSNAEILQNEIPGTFADTAGDRIISESLVQLLDQYMPVMPKNAALVIALGTNSTNPTADIATLKNVIAKYSGQHHIVLVTPADFRAGGPFNSDTIADWEVSIKGKYPNVSIADWRAAASIHPEYLDADGTHIGDRPEGRAAWISLVKAALAEK